MKATYVDHMGNDLRVVNSARVSFNKDSSPVGWTQVSLEDNDQPDYPIQIPFLAEKDQKLIKYLAKHNHWTPFGHPQLTIHIKVPIFVARQLDKHQVGLVKNEVSRRYVSDPVEFWEPDFWRRKAVNLKQGSSEEEVKDPFKPTGICMNCSEPIQYHPNIQEGSKAKQKYCSSKCQNQQYRKDHKMESRFVSWKNNARTKGFVWELNYEDVEWPVKCPILGIELDYDFFKEGGYDNSPSLDRIDSSKGYTRDNIQVISARANRAKSDLSSSELISMAEWSLLSFKGLAVKDTEPSYKTYLKESAATYQKLLDAGVCAEQARAVLPQAAYTEFYWTGSLAAFIRICKLRIDAHAQKETRLVAEQIAHILKTIFPYSYGAHFDQETKESDKAQAC